MISIISAYRAKFIVSTAHRSLLTLHLHISLFFLIGIYTKKVWYCCRDHQLKDWKTHKIKCKEFVNEMKEGYYNPDGWSSLKWDSGAVYRGELRSGKPHGKGGITYANGDVFDGTWKDGMVVSGKWGDGQQPHISFALIGLQPSHATANNYTVRLGLQDPKCKHGVDCSSEDDMGLIQDFYQAWSTAFHTTHTNVTIMEKFQSAHDATIRKYYKVWSKLEMMEQVKKCSFSGGTHSIVHGILWTYYTFGKVQSTAAIACYFDQYVDVFLKKTQATMNWAKITKLRCASEEHTFVKYFRSHIPCSCLDGVHRELKEMRGEKTDDVKEGALEAQLRQLNVADDDNDDDAKVQPCSHGLFQGGLETEKIRVCDEFTTEFTNRMNMQFAGKRRIISDAFAAVNGEMYEKYQDVWTNLAMMEDVITCFLFQGTESLLRGNDYSAAYWAMIACYFEELLACTVHKTSSIIDWSKVLVLDKPDQNTLVRFLKTRIPCSCLDAKYKEVRSTTKMGICMNTKCSLPEKKVELSEMKHCTRCRRASYCSRECQKAHWSVHKDFCTQVEVRDAALANEQWLTKQFLSGALSMTEGPNGGCILHCNPSAQDEEENKKIAAQQKILMRNHLSGADGKEKK